MIMQFMFFPRVHVNEFSNLIGSLHGPDLHGNVSAMFCPFAYKSAFY